MLEAESETITNVSLIMLEFGNLLRDTSYDVVSVAHLWSLA